MDSEFYILFNFLSSGLLWLGIIILIVLKKSIITVPQNMVYVIERFGKYQSNRTAGLNFLFPFIDKIAHHRDLREQTIDVNKQEAITKDNIGLGINGILFIKVVDAYKASYGVQNYALAVTNLAQTTMRAEIGKKTLDETFEARETLNSRVVEVLTEAGEAWGVQVLRYEIKDIDPPKSVLDAMEKQMKAEREKRATILESEGSKESAINQAQGEKQAQVLKAAGEKEARILQAEADKQEQVLSAQGEALAITTVAQAKATALEVVGKAAETKEGSKAVQFQLAENAIAAHQSIAQESTVVLMDGQKSGTANVVAEALAVSAAITKQGGI
ncbi:MAG: paraslipin [Magnetococcales bacterium]|nr:paraslipin [Magnetococcales bacterium]